MRKIEVVVPDGLGSTIAGIANNAGAYESVVLNAHGPKTNKDVVSISASEQDIDCIIERIKTYCKRSGVKADVRIWDMETPLAKKEYKTVPYEELKSNAYHSSTIDFIYIVLIALSAILSALGLMMDSAIVIIGAMIIAPVLKPIMTASLGTVNGDFMLLLRGVGALFVGICVGITAVFMMAFLIPFTQTTPLLLAVSQMNLLMIGIAFVAGMIAAVSMVSDLSQNLAGVSIAVALMPPIAAVAINAFSWFVGMSSFGLFGSSVMVLIINCLAINIGGTLVFYFAGFKPKGKTRMLTKEFGIAFVLLLVFSIPFFYVSYVSYKNSLTENTVIGVVKSISLNSSARIQSVKIEQGTPLNVEIVIISKEQPPPRIEEIMRVELEQELRRQVEVELFYVQAEKTIKVT